MRNLSNLNDLYNAQDVIILLEIIENRFQSMQDKSGYNLRIINSASKLNGCIQREKSKCILALPINNNIDQSFKAFKRDDLKVVYSLKLDNEETFKKKRIITKIIKFDENNQYGFAMTKPIRLVVLRKIIHRHG